MRGFKRFVGEIQNAGRQKLDRKTLPSATEVRVGSSCAEKFFPSPEESLQGVKKIMVIFQSLGVGCPCEGCCCG